MTTADMTLPNGKLSVDRYIGQTVGAMRVIGNAVYVDRSNRKRGGFEVEFTCCGKLEVISRERLSNAAKRLPKTCRDCAPPPPPPTPRDYRERMSEQERAEKSLSELNHRMADWRRDPDTAERRAANAARVQEILDARRAMLKPYRPHIPEQQVRAALGMAVRHG